MAVSPLLVAVVIASCVLHVMTYPSGAPTSQCTSLTPGHGSQQSGNPYSLDIGSVTSYKSGTPVTVIVKGGDFQGLMLQARRKDNAKSVGSFSSPGSNFKLLTCHSNSGSTVTHSNQNTKNNVSFTWNPPTSNEGSVEFVATVNRVKDMWWRNVKSSTLTSGNSGSPTGNGTSGLAAVTLFVLVLAAGAMYVRI